MNKIRFIRNSTILVLYDKDRNNTKIIGGTFYKKGDIYFIKRILRQNNDYIYLYHDEEYYLRIDKRDFEWIKEPRALLKKEISAMQNFLLGKATNLDASVLEDYLSESDDGVFS